MPNSIKKSWAVHPFMSHWQGGIYLHEKGQIAPKWSWAHFFSRRSFLWQKVCVGRGLPNARLPERLLRTRTYLQLLRCWLRGWETKFNLDCLLAACTWQKLQHTHRGKLCICGSGTEAGHSWGNLMFWKCVITLPHSSLTNGVSPVYLSRSILGIRHCGIEVPLV